MNRYDATAHIYDMRYSGEQITKITAALKNVKVDENSVVLDAGCGTGLLFDYVACRVYEVVGIDVSKKTLIEAKKRTERLMNVFLVQADVDNLPFRETFTHVFAITVLQNTPNPTCTLKDLRRVAKDGAVVVVTGLKKIFPRRSFAKLLSDADLKARLLDDEKNLKCYIAICSVLRH